MSNPPTNYITLDQNTQEYKDLINIFAIGNSGYTTGYIANGTFNNGSGTPITNPDLGSIFAANTSYSSVAFNTNYKYQTNDLTNVFAPKITYAISDQNSSINVTEFTCTNTTTTTSYQVIIFDYSGDPYWPYSTSGAIQDPPTAGSCNITFNSNLDVNLYVNTLIIGGGGGGGQGYNSGGETCGGCGGGGGSIIFQNENSLILPMNTTFNIQVGYNGGGNVNPAATTGSSTGGGGGESFITSTIDSTALSLTAYGGGGGGGIGAVAVGGGTGGSSSYNYLNSGPTDLGGGGGGGGGTLCSDRPGPRVGGSGGNYTFYTSSPTNDGNNGDNSGSGGGTGGESFYTNVQVPFANSSGDTSSTNVYCGNAGGGGSNSTGGGAGGTSGGAGGGSSSSSGESATNGYVSSNFFYGNGGGGSSIGPVNTSYSEANGAAGVVMIWWEI